MTPAIVIAGVRSGVGKTTIAAGIMAALTRRGYDVQPFKAGPDYIDPSYHEIACGRPSRNLDTWLLPHPVVLELFQRAAARSQVSVIEGVMGVFDGHGSLTEEGSTAQLAKLLGAPVVLVADASKVARSVAAEVLGYQQFDPELNIVGVVLNGIGGPRHLEFCQPQIEATTGLPVLGYLPRRDEFIQPERHLGLIPAVEGTVANRWYDSLVDQMEDTFDLDRLVDLAGGCDAPMVSPQVFPPQAQPKRARIAIARDKAFSFYYQDSLDLLEAWGAELAPFSPLDDRGLPEGTGGIYIGGGFPEMFASQLSANSAMHAAIRKAVERGVPVYGECGGLMYLGQSISDLEGVRHPMVGAIPAVSAMSEPQADPGLPGDRVPNRQSLDGERPAGEGPRVSLVRPGAASRFPARGVHGGGPGGPGGRLPVGQRMGLLPARAPGRRTVAGPEVRRRLRPTVENGCPADGPRRRLAPRGF